MTVDSFVIGDKFVVRVIKHHINNPDRKWGNTYEFVAIGAGTEGDLLTAGTAVVAFEKLISTSIVVYDRLTISSWEEDSVPYNPQAFISSSISGVGALGAATEPIALSNCLSVTRVASFGRFGHLFYRGNLLEGDVHSPAGKSVLFDQAGKQTLIETALTTSALEVYLNAEAPTTLQLSLINKAGTQVRGVVGLVVAGVSQVPMDHTWFNRTPAGP